jgi:FkbM family methyltransferase
MLGYLKVVLSDFIGLIRVCGLVVAAKWLLAIGLNITSCIKVRNLQPADIAMGIGPFRVRFGKAHAFLTGERVISGIREIWVRDAYLGNGFLSIPPDAMVVDLGANMGNFTLLALAHDPNVQAICVQPGKAENKKREQQLKLNGWQNRVRNCPYFIGGETEKHTLAMNSEDYADSSFITEDEFVQKFDLTKIDFLKCDIEGSEFELFHKDSLLLNMSRQLAIELHGDARCRENFTIMLRKIGFEVIVWQDHNQSSVVLAKKLLMRGKYQ